ncbi:MAG: hypothetical protein AB1401_00545 [Thermodesulfobacteriota bacterium]
MKSTIKIKGKVKIELFDKDGKLKDVRDIAGNLVVDDGLSHIADQMSDQGEAQMSHMAIGVGTTAPDPSDTALESELDRNALTSVTQTDNEVEYIGDWAAGDGTGAITEAGIFNDPAAGTMLARITFAVINKAANDQLRITWTHTYSAA